jgi:hypothetical protein
MEIPRRAVFNSNEVFIVSGNVIRKATINILRINQQTIIFNGIEEGVFVVTEPLVNVAEGSLVEVY